MLDLFFPVKPNRVFDLVARHLSLWAVIALLCQGFLLRAAAAEGPVSPLMISGGTLYPVSGEPIEDGVVIVRDGLIEAIGPASELAISDLSANARCVDASGWTVIPGLVDCGSRFLLDSADATVFHAWHELRDALDGNHPFLSFVRREGVTTVGVFAETDGSVGGLGSVVKLKASSKAGSLSGLELLRHEAFLLLALGDLSDGRSSETSARLSRYYELRGALKSARDYRRDWQRYRENVEKYNQDLRKYKAALAEFEKIQKARTKENEDGKKPKEGEKHPGQARDTDGEEKENKKKEGGGKKPLPPTADVPEKPQPPKRPSFNLDREVLIKLLDGEIPAWVTAHRRDEIEYAIRIKREFELDLTLLGGTEAYSRSKELVDAKIPVVLGPVLLRKRGLNFLHHRESNALTLAEAGVPLSLAGLEAEGLEARHLRLQAAVALRGGLDHARALEAITLEPARRLGVDARVGSLEKGKDADFVILDGDPLSATTRVLKVIIGGEIVYSNENVF